jgi:hypothetical protein
MPQSFYPTVPFPIDHIIARQHGGSTTLDNLALSCLHDNTHKGPNIAGIDPLTRRITRLFNPRRDKWERHFQWDGPNTVRHGICAILHLWLISLFLWQGPGDAEARDEVPETP